MKFIAHRRNTIEQLRDTNPEYGVEVDIRSLGDRLVIHHDPFLDGVDFGAWMDEFRHGTLILNVKEEGLEERLISQMKQRGIEDYFFLDQSFPFLIKWSGLGEHRCAVRVSEFETVETALSLSGRVDWVWIDCFTHLALTGAQACQLKKAEFQLCLVSPELQGRDAEVEIPQLADLLVERSIALDAVCSKRIDLWEELV